MEGTMPVCRAGGKLLTISHPAPNSSLPGTIFVVSGLSDPQIEFVVGRLINQSTNEVVHGKTIFNPPTWGIYFRGVPRGTYTLEVIGISIDPQTGATTTYPPVSQSLDIVTQRNEVTITWPGNGDSACLSNFAPYGTYNPEGTVTVTVQIGSDGSPISPDDFVQNDGGWAAQFLSLTQESSDYELHVSNDAGGQDERTGLNLSLGNC